MAKTFEKAVTGFNHNVKHKGKVYHVQTEDSGVSNPHLITHLFVGGNILASKKTSYADMVKAENLPELVREMMEEQHKEMLRNLINGVYDKVGADRLKAYQPGQLATDEESKAAQAQHGVAAAVGLPMLSPPGPQPSAPQVLPPEVVAARNLPEPPQLKTEGAETLFGEDLISEKSLDEVILSYLAADDASG